MLQRSYTTVHPKRQQDEEPVFASSDSPLATGDSQYLDFVLAGYGAASKAKDAIRARPVADNSGLRRSSHEKASDTATGANPRPGARGQARTTHDGRSRPSKPALAPEVRARVAARLSSLRRGRHLRPQDHSIRSDLRTSAVFSSVWNTRFCQIARQYDKQIPEHYLLEPGAITLSVQATEWVERLLDQMSQGDRTLNIEAFARRYGKLGREVWSEVALWLLCYQKHSLLDFLVATHEPLYPPINWVEDCLYYLASHYNSSQQNTEPSFQLLIQVFLRLADRETREQYVFTSSFVRLLIPHCTHEQLNQLYSTIKLGKARVHYNTLLHFADHFAKHGHIEQALDALLEAKNVGAKLDSVSFRSCCSMLLRRSIQHPAGMRLCLRLIENFVSIGVKLDRRLCNIVMLNAVEAGDLDTADAVHRSAIEQGFQPDAYTCSIRLKACKADIANAERLRLVIEEAIVNGNVRQNMVVATDIIHCLALHHTESESRQYGDSAFDTIATAYMQLFDAAPLERLGLEMPQTPASRTDELVEQRMSPSPHVVGFMLAVYLYLQRRINPPRIHQLYIRWRELVESGDQVLAACATTPHLCNIFLKRFTQARDTLLQAALVVKDMQKPLPDSAGVQQAKPDVYTWSIFLYGFTRRGETKLAEQVISYMNGRGIRPNHVTWNMLVGGYATAQDAEGTLDSLRRLEQSGTAWSEWTHKGLRRFQDKQRLRLLLEQQRLEQSLDFSGELKEGLAQKLSEPGEVADEYGSSVDDPTSRSTSRSSDAGGFADSSAELAEMTGRTTHV